MPRARGGIDLGGTKIQAVVVDADSAVLGQARLRRRPSGGPADVAAAMAEALREAAEAAGRRDRRRSPASASAPPARSTRDAGTVCERAQPARLGRQLPARATRSASALGAPVRARQRRPGRHRRGVRARRRRAASARCSASSGAPASAAGSCSTASRGSGRGAAGEIGHVVVEMRRPQCPCGRRGCLEAYAGRGAMEARARKLHAEGRKTDLFKIMERARPHAADERHLGARARARRRSRTS